MRHHRYRDSSTTITLAKTFLTRLMLTLNVGGLGADLPTPTPTPTYTPTPTPTPTFSRFSTGVSGQLQRSFWKRSLCVAAWAGSAPTRLDGWQRALENADGSGERLPAFRRDDFRPQRAEGFPRHLDLRLTALQVSSDSA